MAGMWLAEFPLARFTAQGAPAGSSNPIVDHHVVYAMVLVVLALAAAGTTWGLGRAWARITGDSRWLRCAQRPGPAALRGARAGGSWSRR